MTKTRLSLYIVIPIHNSRLLTTRGDSNGGQCGQSITQRAACQVGLGLVHVLTLLYCHSMYEQVADN
ncbi:hypothetical protein J6590_062311 [Homalodisca vitripennis]|nr:hypothetical protein J6590_062311 [Homalodisca vitripennis]